MNTAVCRTYEAGLKFSFSAIYIYTNDILRTYELKRETSSSLHGHDQWPYPCLCYIKYRMYHGGKGLYQLVFVFSTENKHLSKSPSSTP